MPELNRSPENVNLGALTPWVENGLTEDILLVIPPRAPLSPFSNVTPDKCGKLPGLPTPDGWVGHRGWTRDFVSRETLGNRLTTLAGAPYSVGLQARRLHAFDVDTDSRDFAEAAADALRDFATKYGYGVRIGKPPGFLVPFRVVTPRHKARLQFVHEITGETAAIELLGQGQQYVVAGRHPKTGQPYRWLRGPCHLILPEAHDALAALPAVPDSEANDLWAELPRRLLEASWAPLEPSRRLSAAMGNGNGSGGGHADPAPSLEAVRDALAWLPNKPVNRRSRDAWVAIAHAVAGATTKSEGGRAAFLDWSAEWDGGGTAMDNAEKLWNGISLENVFVGWHWLASLADDESAGQAGLVVATDFADDFEEPAPENSVTDIFDEPHRERATLEEISAAINRLSEASTEADIDPVLEMLVPQGHITQEQSLKAIKTATGTGMGALRRRLARIVGLSVDGEGDAAKRLANVTLAAFGNDKLAWRAGEWLHFNGKFWAPIKAVAIKKKMQEAIAEDDALLMSAGMQRPHSMSTTIAQAMDLLEGMTGTRFDRTEELEFALRPAINLRNGTLWVNIATGEISFGSHKPDDLFLYACNVDYDPGALCPRYLELVKETLSRTHFQLDPGHKDYPAIRTACDHVGANETRPAKLPDGRLAWKEEGAQIFVVDVGENLRMLEEMMGYTLVPWRGASAFAIWKGNGRNGKSMLIETLKRFLSRDAVMTRRLGELEDDRFATAELAGKLLFVDDDMAYRAILPDGTLKTISENHSINAARKHLGTLQFICTTFPVLLCNSWPLLKDFSKGMRARAVVLNFNRTFDASVEGNPWLEVWGNDREMSGILNRWLAGLIRVLKNKQISQTLAAEQGLELWLNHNSPVLEFVSEACLTQTPKGVTSWGDTLRDLYSAYHGWHLGQTGSRTHVYNRVRFAEILEQLGYKLGRRGDGKYVTGLWLKDATLRDNVVDFGTLS